MRKYRSVGMVCLALLASVPVAAEVQAETIISKTVTYFPISGKTAEDLDRELSRRGPVASSTGMRHPGATRIKFGGSVTYEDTGARCSVKKAKVTLSTKIILPKWTNRKHTNAKMALIWDTLAADIKRHEERHAEIARNHARQLEKTLLNLRASSSCTTMKDRVAEASANEIKAHSEDQARFDRIEAVNFENRMIRLLRYRMSQ